MFSRQLSLGLLGVAAAAAVIYLVRAADQHLDLEYAEHLPLVPESLLLDIIALPGRGFVAVGERGHVVYSENGEDWTQAEAVPTRSTLTRVTRAGNRLWAAGHDTAIITSGDWGDTWTLQNFEPERQQPIMDILFLDEQNGLAIGAYDLYMVTADGGVSWQEAGINGDDWHNNAILDLGYGRLMIAGEAGFSYRSEDGGESWETLEMPYGGSMFGIVEGSGDCIIVYGLRGHVQESCDFGDSWQQLDTGTEASIAGATRWQDSNWFVGNSGLVLRRQGRGPFQVDYHSSGVDFAAIVPDEQGGFLLVGEDGIHHYPEQGAADG